MSYAKDPRPSERAAAASHAERLRRQSERFNEDISDLLYEDSLKECRRSGHDLELGYDAVAHVETLTCTRCETRFVEEV